MRGINTEPINIDDMTSALQKIREFVPSSPLVSLEPLNIKIGTRVYLKLESLLPSGAYKYRGAINKISKLVDTYGDDIHIITASSGNHGMACALAAHNLNIKATIVVPEHTPKIKIMFIEAIGGKVIIHGEEYDKTFEKACHLAKTKNLFYVHPVADKDIVGGQGTISLEILEQDPQVDQVIVAIGGGGLITGISFAMKYLKPNTSVIGVMPENSDVYFQSRKAGKMVELEKASSIADAVVRKTAEPYLYPYIEKYVDQIVTVTEKSICKAVKESLLYGKVTLEGAGALPLAAILEKKVQLTDNTVLICSGGNIDQNLLEMCLNEAC